MVENKTYFGGKAMKESVGKGLRWFGVFSIVVYIAVGLMFAGYVVGNIIDNKKEVSSDFMGQHFSTYKVYDTGVICKYVDSKNGWICKGMPSEFYDAVKTIFNFDGIKYETDDGDEAPKKTTMNTREIKRIVNGASAVYGVDKNLVLAIIYHESRFKTNARSNRDCIGLMQLSNNIEVSDRLNPTSNVYAGTRHFKKLLIRYDGNTRLALAAYNAGEGAVNRYGGVPPYKETINYVNDIMNTKRKLDMGIAIV